jgi:hypothetical protein
MTVVVKGALCAIALTGLWFASRSATAKQGAA